MGAKDDITVRARKVISSIWDSAHLRGRCWGKVSTRNSYGGTNITVAVGNELVSISESNGKLVFHEFTKVTNTSLGDAIKKLLNEAGLI